MEIIKSLNGDELTITIKGRLDTVTAPDLEKELNLDDVKKLIVDLNELDYISSAGLRVILNTQKVMNKNGSMVIRNAKPEIMEIFDMTGFSSILTIE